MQSNKPLEIFGMSMDHVCAIAETAPKGKLLHSLTAAYKAQELAAAKGKPTASARPAAPARPATSAARPSQPRQAAAPSRPAPAPAPARPAPAPSRPAASSPTLNAQALAVALLDEQDRRAKASLVKSRAEFTSMKPAAALAFVKAGGKII